MTVAKTGATAKGGTSVAVRVEPADQADVAALMRRSDEVAAHLYPGAFRQPIDARSLDRSDIVLLMARGETGEALGCCVLRLLDETSAELKRMIVDPKHQGRGVGRALVAAAITTATARSLARILLEVGARNREARALYERMGFRDRGPFGTYAATPIATFMEREIGDRATR